MTVKNIASETISQQALSEAPGNVRLSSRIARGGEELRRRAEFDELADQQKSGEIADARGLLHVVSHDDQGANIL